MSNKLTVTASKPPNASAEAQRTKRQQASVERFSQALQQLVDTLEPAELDQIAMAIERSLGASTPRVQQAHVSARFAGRDFDDRERAELEIAALLQFFRRRRELLAGALTAPQVAKLLNTSRQTPYDRAKSGTLLAVMDRGALRFPAWQFDAEGPDGVIASLPAVIRALNVPPLSKVSWLVRANPYLDGKTPLQALREGEVERVVSEAHGVEAL